MNDSKTAWRVLLWCAVLTVGTVYLWSGSSAKTTAALLDKASSEEASSAFTQVRRINISEGDQTTTEAGALTVSSRSWEESPAKRARHSGARLIRPDAGTSVGFKRRGSAFARRDELGRMKIWVFFRDKALPDEAAERAAIEEFRSRLAPRALWRREKVGTDIDFRDLPLAAAYVSDVEGTGATVATRSRWLNAVSVYADRGQAAQIARLPFVKSMRPVAKATKKIPEMRKADAGAPVRGGGRALDYGGAWDQLDQIQVPALHDDGFDGSGIIIAMLDTGFDTDHQVYRQLNIMAEHDFINDDGETADEPGDPEGQDSHGTATLSCVAGAYAGELYGGSYMASIILCKTEILDDEIEIEEDYWVEAAEWAETLGADIISSSLGYFYWYTYEDMDGDTCVTTIAADIAAERGIVVVNSMGNEGTNDWKYMIAPADGDTVLSLGAVNVEGEREEWSSVGPTYDGRIKPEVMAMGRNVYVATTEDTASYAHSGGTSFSCPLAAGAVGLLLQGHPEWTPLDVIEALRATATQSSSPDTLMGWGIMQAHDAMYSQPVGVEGSEPVAAARLWTYPNPSSPETMVRYSVPSEAHVRIAVYDVAGRLVRTLRDAEQEAGDHVTRWDGRDSSGERAASGVYFCRMTVGASEAATKITLLR